MDGKDLYRRIGERIALLRVQRDITQQTLADVCKVRTAAVHNWEQGKTGMSVENFVQVARVFNVSLDELAFGKRR